MHSKHINRDTTWNLFMAQTWTKFRPPVRPSEVMVKVFERVLDKTLSRLHGKADVLILGATPELRDLAVSRNLRPTVVDYRADHYRALAQLMKYHGPERYVEQNWITMTLDRSFDLVMADASLNVISGQSLPTLLRNVAAHMNRDSVFVTRVWVRLEDRRPDVRAIIREYRDSLASTMSFYPTCLGPLQQCFYDEERDHLSLTAMASGLRKLFEEGVLCEEEWRPIEELDYDNVGLNLYIPFQTDFSSLIKPIFKVQETVLVDEPYAEYCPIYTFEPTTDIQLA